MTMAIIPSKQPGTALAEVGHCACCGMAVPGFAAAGHKLRIRLDYHRHPWSVFVCIGSRSLMRRLSDWLDGVPRAPR